jgi:hypothetical protein
MDRKFTQILPRRTTEAKHDLTEGRKGNGEGQAAETLSSIATSSYASVVVNPDSGQNIDWETVGGGSVETVSFTIRCSFDPVYEQHPYVELAFALPAIIWLGLFVTRRKFTVRSLFALTFCYAVLMGFLVLR